MNKRTLVVDQLYNLAAGFLYALSICYFARGSDFAPGGISGLALIVNYLWHLPVGITTLVFNLPLVALSIRFVGRAFLAKSLVSMVWCTVFQDVVFARVGCYTGDPLVAALFAGVTWGFALALLYMRGSSSGGTDFLTMSIKVLRPHLSIGAVTGGIDLVVILLGWPVFGTVDSVLYGLVTTVITSLVIDKVMYGSSSSKMLTIITTKGAGDRRRDLPRVRARLHHAQGHWHLHPHRAADAPLRLRPAPGLPHPHRRLPHRPRLHGHGHGGGRSIRRGLY